MNNRKSVIILLLLISFLSVFVFHGCGNDGTSSVSISATPTPGGTTSDTLHDPELTMVSKGVATKIFSGTIGYIMKALNGGVLMWIGMHTSGRVLDIIANKLGFGTTSTTQLDEILVIMNQLLTELSDINSKLSSLETQLALTQVNLESYISTTALQQYITVIKAKFDTMDTSGFMYYANAGAQLDANTDPNVECFNSRFRVFMTQYVLILADCREL